MPSLLGLGRDLTGVDTRPDARVVAFTAVASVATGLFVWLTTALLLTRRRAVDTRPAAGAGRAALGLRRSLVVLQVALSLVLFCSAALLSRSLFNVLSVDPGFDANGLAAFSVNPLWVGYEGDRLAAIERTLLERVRALPGVTHAAAASALPLAGGGGSTFVHTGEESDRTRILVDEVSVDDAYFATLGLPLRSGRGFSNRDVEGAPEVCIVNDTLALALAGRGEAAGGMLGYEGRRPTVQIVGVVRDTRQESLKAGPVPTLFRPRAQAKYGAIGILIRTATPGVVTAAAVTALVKGVDTGVAVTRFGSVAEFARAALLRERMLAGLSVVFAGLSALLAVMGLFGVASFNVVRRTREIRHPARARRHARGRATCGARRGGGAGWRGRRDGPRRVRGGQPRAPIPALRRDAQRSAHAGRSHGRGRRRGGPRGPAARAASVACGPGGHVEVRVESHRSRTPEADEGQDRTIGRERIAPDAEQWRILPQRWSNRRHARDWRWVWHESGAR